ncbi:hypothetical protein QJS04_geneDACA014603 [Acorus gramineus]|uniref:DUF538 family protein n=1 Tax=Acorus gramineus TaxID=55184 RepID=A0AAV9ANN6_ACOGR|nr:hypothetical protein QJS04_geneDACA014603 [Acorus gramineus]
MKTLTVLPFLLGLALTITAPLSASASHPLLRETVHDLLNQYGLPKGLIPDSVASYTPVGSDGSFEVVLRKPCYVQFSDLVYYDRKITGKISYGKITDLSGIQAKKLFVWVPITGISADESGGTIEFQVGFLSEKLPANEFAQIPTCRGKGCGHHRKALPDEILMDGVLAQV